MLSCFVICACHLHIGAYLPRYCTTAFARRKDTIHPCCFERNTATENAERLSWYHGNKHAVPVQQFKHEVTLNVTRALLHSAAILSDVSVMLTWKLLIYTTRKHTFLGESIPKTIYIILKTKSLQLQYAVSAGSASLKPLRIPKFHYQCVPTCEIIPGSRRVITTSC